MSTFVIVEDERETQLRKELTVEQVVNVTHEYQPGSPRLERLYAQLAEINRFQEGEGT